jgi:hypothetical protein
MLPRTKFIRFLSPAAALPFGMRCSIRVRPVSLNLSCGWLTGDTNLSPTRNSLRALLRHFLKKTARRGNRRRDRRLTPMTQRITTLHLYQVGMGLTPISCRTRTAYSQKARFAWKRAFSHQRKILPMLWPQPFRLAARPPLWPSASLSFPSSSTWIPTIREWQAARRLRCGSPHE